MTAARPGDAFHLDLDRTVIAGRYLEVDPPAADALASKGLVGAFAAGTAPSVPALIARLSLT
jgi:hypothetical protein